MAPFSALPAKIIFLELSFLSAHGLLLSAQSVSRQFYVLATRQRTRALLPRLTFEVGLPADGPFVKTHKLSFSHVPPPPPNRSCLYNPHSTTLADEAELLANSKFTLIPPPRAHLTLPKDLIPYPINIETPFESFRTVIWCVGSLGAANV